MSDGIHPPPDQHRLSFPMKRDSAEELKEMVSRAEMKEGENCFSPCYYYFSWPTIDYLTRSLNSFPALNAGTLCAGT